MARGDLAITLFNPAGDLKGTFDADAADLTYRTTAPGGCLDATWTMARSILQMWDDFDFPFDVQITDTEGIVWRGNLEAVAGDPGALGDTIAVTALCTQASDEEAPIVAFLAGTAIEDAFSTIRSIYMPRITTEKLAATGRALTADLTLTKKRPGAVFNILRRYGSGADVELMWFLWPDGAGNAWQLVLEEKQGLPGYYISSENYQGSIGWDAQNYANRQCVEYNGGANTVTVDDVAEQTARGLARSGKTITMNEITNGSDALFVATVALNSRKKLRMTGEQASISNPLALEDANRQLVELWRVRAGMVLALEGPQPALSGEYSPDRNALFIVATTYHAASGILDLTFESFETTLDGVLAGLLAALA